MAEELKPEDFRTAVWKKIENKLNERLDAHRRKNDGNLSAEETNRVRGRIAEVKAILGLAKEPPAIPADHHPD